MHDWAEARFMTDADEPCSEACNEVLAQLDCMNMNLLTAEDIPVLIEALSAADPCDVLGRLSGPDTIERRRHALRSNPFYAPFCG